MEAETRVSPESLALVSACCFAASHVTSKRGLQTTSIIGGLLVQLSAAFAVVIVAVLLDPPDSIRLGAVGVFALGGLFAPGIARATTLVGVDKLGPSIAVPIQQGARPLLAVLGAIILLGETVDLLGILGIAGIAIGGWVLSRYRGRSGESEPSSGLDRRSPLFRPGVAFPLITAVFYAASDMVVKTGLGASPNPSFGAMVGIGTALLVWLCAAGLFRPIKQRVAIGRGALWFALSGAMTGIALLSLFRALEQGDVSLVSPIIASQTLVVFLLSSLFLRDMERLGLGTLVGGAATVGGVILVST